MNVDERGCQIRICVVTQPPTGPAKVSLNYPAVMDFRLVLVPIIMLYYAPLCSIMPHYAALCLIMRKRPSEWPVASLWASVLPQGIQR